MIYRVRPCPRLGSKNALESHDGGMAQAGGILFPKEKDSSEISQFPQISLLHVKGKIFFSMVAHRLPRYLQRNHLIDTSHSGCLELASTIWHQIQVTKKEGKELHVVFLDLANGSVPHNLSGLLSSSSWSQWSSQALSRLTSRIFSYARQQQTTPQFGLLPCLLWPLTISVCAC